MTLGELLHGLIDTAIILGILYLDWQILLDGRKSLALYSEYFQERTRWYKSRGKNRSGSVAGDTALPAATGGDSAPALDASAAAPLGVPAGEGSDQ